VIVAGTEPAVAKRPHGELALRVASALVMAPAAILAAYLGGWWFDALWTLAAVAILWEWVGLVADPARKPLMLAAAPALAAVGAFLVTGHQDGAVAAIAIVVAAATVTAPAGKRAWACAGAAYAGAMLAAPVTLRSDTDHGFVAVIYLFAVVWATDIAAYFAGRFIGGPKLWPAVSPKKTWSGAVGGTVAAVAAGAIVATSAGLDNQFALGFVSLGLSVLAQIGDFSESALKRRFGAKDASHLIPGHGGLMDRLDGFWAAAVAGTVLGLWRGGIHAPAQGLLIW
jgi:phosphatidate cytidylyltransferase